MAPRAPGFVRSLFLGRLSTDGVFPFPTPFPETLETADEIAAMARDWAREHVDPAAIDREKEIPRSVIDGLKELGLFGLTVPEEHGGAGMGQYVYARMMEAVANRCASTVTVLGGHLGLGLKGILLYGTPAQQRTWLPPMASGEIVAAFALTEATAGSDAGALRMTAERRSDGAFVLDGRKVWITNGGFADLFVAFARTPHPERADAPLLERPISCFLVRGDLPGVSRGAPEDKMGLCGSSTTEIGFEEVVVPADCLLGPEGQGFKVALNVLNAGRHGLASCCIGQAKLARDLALAHAREREQFGRPIASFGMVQELLAGMDADIYAMESGTWLAALMIDAGERETMLEAACCKVFATEALWRIANDALQVTGGTGFMREYAFERIVRDARINMIFEGTNQILRSVIGRQGIASMVADEGAGRAEPTALEGVDPSLVRVRALLVELVGELADRARCVEAEFGSKVRDAQLPLKRLADMAIALFTGFAVLARASRALAEPADPADQARERAVARLACQRQAAAFRRALAEERDSAHDRLVAEVARGMR
jgi:acyl-CoA dehydrogenase family protein 9